MNTRDVPSSALSGIWVPHITSIADFRGVIHHIQSVSALDVVSKCIGIKRLIDEVMWDQFYGRTSSSMDVFYENQEMLEETCGISVDELYLPIRGLEEYLSLDFLNQLSEEKRNGFREEGFTVSAWVSSTHAVIASTSGREFPSGSPRAARYWNTLSAMDVDPRLEECYPGGGVSRSNPAASSAHGSERHRRVSRY